MEEILTYNSQDSAEFEFSFPVTLCLTLLGLGLIKINYVSANFSNPRHPVNIK